MGPIIRSPPMFGILTRAVRNLRCLAHTRFSSNAIRPGTHRRNLIFEELEDRTLLNGVTLITHGQNDNASDPAGWVRARSTIICRISIISHMGGYDSSTPREMSCGESELQLVEYQSRSLPFGTLFRRAKHVLPVLPWYAWSRSD